MARGVYPRPLPIERFMTKFEVCGACWVWTGEIMNSGYGRFHVGPKASDRKLAHVFSYEHFIGPVPDGMVIDHVEARGCRGYLCVNFDHLEAVTQQENVLRYKRRSHCIKRGHAMTPENTYIRIKDGAECHECKACRNIATARYKARVR